MTAHDKAVYVPVQYAGDPEPTTYEFAAGDLLVCACGYKTGPPVGTYGGRPRVSSLDELMHAHKD